MNEIIKNKEMNDQYFITNMKSKDTGEFKYVQIKINAFKESESKSSGEAQFLIQIIDISVKMMYNSIKAEK